MIPNIIKGSGITGAIRYNMGEGNDKLSQVRKELAPGATSRSEILGGQNFGFEIDSAARVELARRVMEFNALPENQAGRTRKCVKDCLHLSLSWEASQRPDREEMIEAAQEVLKKLGMAEAQAVFFAHHDTDCPHVHIVASRINPVSGYTFADTLDKVKAQGWALRWEREHDQISEKRQDMHRLADAARAEDRDQVLDLLTARNPTFTAAELRRVLLYGELPEADVKRLSAVWLADDRVIGLRATPDGEIKRYTTRDALAAERQVQAAARDLAAASGFAVKMDHQRDAAVAHTLTKEQADALHHVTKDNGFAIITGQAGAGKSRAYAAIRDAYAAEGFEVIGLAPSHKVKLDLEAKGFTHTATVAAELGLRPSGPDLAAQNAPSAQWHARTVVMVDEAAMLSTKDLATLTERAAQAGAKLILGGDHKQIQSIERGGMFAPLINEHGAASINEVQRIKATSQREAWGLMHKGEFAPAMALFEQDGMLNWSPSAAKAERDLIERFTADVKAAPDKTRFIFAHTNEQVDRLNVAARELARDGGKLGPDVTMATRDGERVFAAGDRIQFTGNGSRREGIQAGFVNGAAGTIREITATDGKARLTVQMDAGKELRFTVGEGKTEFNAFRHGYAGTIFKGQGASIQQTYVLVSKGWDAQNSYVAMTRHMERVAVFTAGDVAATRDALAGVMSRDPNRHAASGYQIDEASLRRSGLDQAAKRMAENLDALRREAKPAAAKSQPAAAKAPETGKAQGRGPAAATAASRAAPGTDRAAGRATGTGKEQGRGPGATKAPPRSGTAATAARAARKGAKAASGIANAAGKIAASVADGFASTVENLFETKAPLTAHEQVEQARDTAAADQVERQAAAEATAAELRERQARERQQFYADAHDAVAAAFPKETENDRRIERENREREERDRGRSRGR